MKKLLALLLTTITAPTVAKYKQTDLDCLARNIYHESRGESLRGKLAVAQVTLNRKMPWQTICEVVYKPYQFSWTLSNPPILDFDSWIESLTIAYHVLNRGYAIRHFPATHYHNHTVQPQWRLYLKPLRTIGNHIFYTNYEKNTSWSS